MGRPRLSSLLLFACLFLPTAALAEEKVTRLIPSKQELEESLRTDWYGVYLVGNANTKYKIGYAKDSMVRSTDLKNPGIVSTLEMKATTKSLGITNELKIVEIYEYEAEPPYAVRRASTSSSDGKTTKVIAISRTEKGFDVTVTAGGEKTTRQIPPIEYTLADSMTAGIWVAHSPKKGDTLTTRSFDLDELKMDKEDRKVQAVTTSVANGVPVTFYEVEFKSHREGITGVERYDRKGNLLSGTLAGVFELRLEPEKQAKDVQQSADLFVLGTIKVDKPLGDPSTVAELIMEISGKEAAVLKSGPRQLIVTNPSGSLTCKLGAPHGELAKATPKEIEDGLAETNDHPINNAKVKALAEQAIGDAQTPREKVNRLVDFVGDYIKPDYRAEPLTLLDLLKVRKGDCKHYALLLTVLARAAGIPAREVHGMLYMGDDLKTFGGHAWTEVVLDGQWIPVDASWKETDINATHLRYGSGYREDLSWLSTFGKLSIKVFDFKPRKETTPKAEPKPKPE
jgi:hypothetical protein